MTVIKQWLRLAFNVNALVEDLEEESRRVVVPKGSRVFVVDQRTQYAVCIFGRDLVRIPNNMQHGVDTEKYE